MNLYLLYEFFHTLYNVFVELDGFDGSFGQVGHFSPRDGWL